MNGTRLSTRRMFFRVAFPATVMLAGCSTTAWHAKAPADVIFMRPDSVRVWIGDEKSSRLVLYAPRAVDDSLVGFAYAPDAGRARVSIPLASVQKTEVRETDVTRTILGGIITLGSVIVQ